MSEPRAPNDNSIARIAVVRGPVEVSLDAENDAVDLVVEPNLAVDERDTTSLGSLPEDFVPLSSLVIALSPSFGSRLR